MYFTSHIKRSKPVKMIFMIFILGVLALTVSDISFAGGATGLYHSYDNLPCGDCHSLHVSGNGGTEANYGHLLHKKDITDLCLSCHMKGNETPATADLPTVKDAGWVAPVVMTLDGVDPSGIAMPAGDFYWANTDPEKGHNPAYTKGGSATSRSMKADSVLGANPPGGSITEGGWSCISCHGIHDRFGSEISAWRQVLRKINGICVTGDVSGYGVETANSDCIQNQNYEPVKSNSRGDIQGIGYINARKDGNTLEGADLFADESDVNKNVYRGGFSSFCSACHGDFHGGNAETRNSSNNNTRAEDSWIRHPANIKMNETGSNYGISTYTAVVINKQGTNPNPAGYDWKYPLVQPDNSFMVKTRVSSAGDSSTAIGDSRIMCLTCHKAHATKYDNMTRWNTDSHSFIANGQTDFEGQVSNGDNLAYGCGKCHQKGGTKAYVKAF
ncbi:MAG: hypothetical protein C4560_08415 [Nitrospiraceae bacterium]|nr:MAG: hypothetical protein C4560_08415 [Nitrospiraceae bacterium]